MARPTLNPPYTCRHCGNFADGPETIERELPGLAALSSAYGASRGAAGLCRRQAIWQDPQRACSGFVLRTGVGAERP